MMLWRFLTSRNTAIVLLIVVSAILLIGAALPNPSIMSPADVEKYEKSARFLIVLGENFNSMKVGRSYAFGLIGVLLVISTTFCSIDRVVKRIKAGGVRSFEALPESKGTTVMVSGTRQDVEEKLISIFRKDRWRTGVYDWEGRRIVSARKGDAGFWGSIFFHAVLITLVAGLVVYFFSAFYATIRFTEGQELKLTEENFLKIDRRPFFGLHLPELIFRFNKFSDEYYADRSATDYMADFDITDMKSGRTWKQVFRINEPFSYKGVDYLLVTQGYSPNFILYKDGVKTDDAFVSLDFDSNYRDSFDIQREGLRVVAQFFPDMARNPDGSVYTKTFRPKNPYFGFEIYQNGVKVFRGLAGRGEGAAFGPYKLVFNDLKYWVTLNLVRETGLGFFFVCAMIGLAGIFIRGLDPEKRITVSIQQEGEVQAVTFYYSAKNFDGMLKEKVEEMVKDIRKQY